MPVDPRRLPQLSGGQRAVGMPGIQSCRRRTRRPGQRAPVIGKPVYRRGHSISAAGPGAAAGRLYRRLGVRDAWRGRDGRGDNRRRSRSGARIWGGNGAGSQPVPSPANHADHYLCRNTKGRYTDDPGRGLLQLTGREASHGRRSPEDGYAGFDDGAAITLRL